MKRASTEGLVGELVRELRPVRPIPRLRVALAGVVGVFAMALAADAAFGAWTPRVGAGSYWADPVFLAVFGGLAVTAAAALAAALAGGVPGREALARRSAGVALVGATTVLVAGLVPLIRTASGVPEATLAQHLACGGQASALGLVPALLACAFLARGSPRRPLVAAGVAAVGAFSLGGVAVHSSCGAAGLHWLLGHSLLPIALAVIAAFPLAVLVGRGLRSGEEPPPAAP